MTLISDPVLTLDELLVQAKADKLAEIGIAFTAATRRSIVASTG